MATPSARDMLMQVQRYANGGTASPESSVGLARALASGTSQEQYYQNIREYVAKNPNPLAALNAASENGVSTADINNALGTKAASDYFTIDYNTETAPSTNVATGFTSALAQRYNAPGGPGQTALDARIKEVSQQYAANTPENAQILRDLFIKEGASIADLQRVGVDPSVLLGTVAKPTVPRGVTEIFPIPIYTPPVVTPETQTQFPQSKPYTATTVYQPLPAPPPIYATGQPALDVDFRNSPARTYDPVYGYTYTPAAKLLPATGAGMSWTPPSVTSRPRELLKVPLVTATNPQYSASQQFARDAPQRAADRLAALTASGERFSKMQAPPEPEVDPNAPVDSYYVKPKELRNYGVAKAAGGEIKKSEGSAQEELARFANGGDASPMSNAELLAQMDRIGATPNAVTPDRDPVKTESRSILDRLKMFTSLDAPKDMSLGETAADIAMGFAPVVGTAQGLRDFERARRDDDTLGMVLGAASAVPIVGGAVKAARTVGKAAKAADDLAALTAKAPTDTPEFKNFFGESKVVNESGQPLRMYHGSGEEITGAFKPNSWWTDDSQYASRMARQQKNGSASNVTPAYLSLNKIARLKDLRSARETLPLGVPDNEVFKVLSDAGFDGLSTMGGTKEIIVFNPNKIKSAISNSGAFDPTNPEITKAQGGYITKKTKGA